LGGVPDMAARGGCARLRIGVVGAVAVLEREGRRHTAATARGGIVVVVVAAAAARGSGGAGGPSSSAAWRRRAAARGGGGGGSGDGSGGGARRCGAKMNPLHNPCVFPRCVKRGVGAAPRRLAGVRFCATGHGESDC
jgi:hypothetical protein